VAAPRKKGKKTGISAGRIMPDLRQQNRQSDRAGGRANLGTKERENESLIMKRPGSLNQHREEKGRRRARFPCPVRPGGSSLL